MSLERDLELYLATAMLAVQDELQLPLDQRASSASDGQLLAVQSFLTQAVRDCHDQHLDRAELLIAGLTRAVRQGWNPEAHVSVTLMGLKRENS